MTSATAGGAAIGGPFRPQHHVLGSDIAGRVESTGRAATRFQPGDDAAALPQAGAIALQGIREKGQVQPEQKVLINGGGGSGMYAVQLAKLDGAEVTGGG